MSTKKKIFVSVIITLLIELFFNFNSIAYFFGNYDEIEINKNDIILNDIDNVDDHFEVTGKKPSIEIKNINKKINNIYFPYSDGINVEIQYTDELFSNYKDNNPKVYLNNKVMYCNFLGKVTKIKFNILLNKNVKFRINSIILNKKLSVFSFIAIAFLLFILIYFSLSFFQKKNTLIFNNEKKQKYIINLIICFFISISILCFVKFSISNNLKKSKEKVDIIYANELTDSILDGHLYLNKKPNNNLINSKNPYDSSIRNYDFLWDTVYFNGKYYVYFGILPSLFLFVPFKAITGHYLLISFVSLIFQILAIIFMAKFYKLLINKYFKKIPFILYAFGLIFVILSSGIINTIDGLHLYDMISIIAFYLVMQGLYFIFKYDGDNKKKSLFLGSLSLSLAVGCRPTMLFISLLIIPIMWKKIKTSKNKVTDLLIFLAPYVLIGLFLMIINYLRFGNIFDFGFKYQLTVTDSRKITSSYYNIIIGIYYYIFQPLRFTPQFPYILDLDINNFIGFCYYDKNVTSIISTIVPLILFSIPIIYKKIKINKELWNIIRNMLILGTFLAGFECLMAGLTRRYLIDFSFLFMFSSILIIFYIYCDFIKNDKYKQFFIKIVGLLFIISFIIQIITIYFLV